MNQIDRTSITRTEQAVRAESALPLSRFEMGIIDQIVSWSTPDEAPPPASRPTLSTPRRYEFKKHGSLDDVLGITSESADGGVPSISSTLSEQFRASTPSEQVRMQQTGACARDPMRPSPCSSFPFASFTPAAPSRAGRVRPIPFDPAAFDRGQLPTAAQLCA